MTTTNPFGRTRLRWTLALFAPVLMLASASALAANCNGSTNNKAKIFQANNNTVYQEGGTVTLNAQIPPSNPTVAQGGIYTWSQVSGPAVTLSPTVGTSTSFSAPHVSTGSVGVVVIKLTVTGATCTGAVPSSETTTINLANLNNFPPVAVATASAASVTAGTSVSLFSTGSYDPDNDPVVYSWTQLLGPAVTILGNNTATASFVAPPVASTTTFRFQLRVTENLPSALSSTATVDVNVVVNNQPPTASLSCPSSINEGALLTLNGSGSSDPENGPLSYDFSQLSGFPLASIPAGPYGSSVSFNAPSLGLGQTGLVQFGLTVTDNGNASASANCSLFIKDVTAPALSGASDITEEATSASGAMATFSVSAYDNVDGASVASCSPASGSTFPIGATTVNCSQNDSAGNVGTASFTVTVQDTTAPVIAAHGDESAEATSAAGAVVSYTSPATSDAVDGPGVASCAPASGSQFALGNTTVYCNATDAHGNAATQTSFNVEVADTTAPDITAPANVTAEATGVLTTVAYDQATATDAVGPVTISSDAPAQFPLGVTTITWTATDGAMNSASATSTVTVVDTTPPVVDDNADQTIEATSAAGAAASFGTPSAHDLVDGDFASTCDYASGATFPIGTTTVTCSATDANNNTGSSSFDITVQDTTPPVIDAHGDETAEATSAAGAIVNYTSPSTSDIVDGAGVASCAPLSGSQFALGDTTVLCDATDARGNAAAQTSFVVHVVDTTPPVIDAHGDETAEATSAAGAVVNYASPATSDAVDGTGVASCAPLSGSQFALGDTTVLCDATDAHGNAAVQTSFVVHVVDTTPPVISAHGNESAEATSAAGAIVSYASPATSDIVDGAGVASCAPASGSQFALGNTTVYCNATDAHGNAATQTSFTVSVVDTTPPVIAAHGNVSAEATGPGGAYVSYVSPATSDIVDGAGTATCAPASGSQFALGNSTVYCNATDAHGNAAAQTSFTVSVVDTTPPVIAAHGNVSAEATGPGGAYVSYASPATSDIVDGAGTATCAPASGSQFALGNTTVHCNATDSHGNHAVQTSFTVSVVDTTAPVISAHGDVTAFATSASGAVVSYTLPTASDLVDGNVPVSCSPASGSTFAVGTTDVTCTATDSHGNTATSHFNVIVSFNFTGFFKPVDNLPVVNVVKAGQGIPVKFSLGGNMGLGIMAAGYPRSVAMTCSSGALQDVVEETVTAGGSSLAYDAAAGQYIYVWKSDKAWAGTCRQLQVKFTDGSIKVANFNFTR